MTESEARLRLKAFVARHGSNSKAAKALGVSEQFIGQLLREPNRPISPKVLAGLGLAREVTIKVKRSA